MSQALAARYSVTYVEDLGSGIYRLTGTIQDDSSASYLAPDILVGDVIIDESPIFGTSNRWKITQIDTAAVRNLVCRVVWDDTGTADPNGPAASEAAICRPSTNRKLAEIPTQAYAKISEVLQTKLQSIDNRLNLDSSSGGEANTASNLGAGAGLFASKVGVDLQFKSLVQGSNVTLTPAGTTVTIAATGEANTTSNSGSGVGLAQTKAGVNLPFKSLVQGANITLTNNANDVTIAATGEANTASNLGTGTDGEALFTTKSGVNLPFKRIKAGTNITLTPETNDIVINSTASGGVVTYQASSESGNEVYVKATGTGITCTRTGNVMAFSIPGGVELLSARIRIAGANLVTGAMIIDVGKGYTGMADRWCPNCFAWREDTGATLTITVTMDTGDFDRVTVNNMNATTTNHVIANF